MRVLAFNEPTTINSNRLSIKLQQAYPPVAADAADITCDFMTEFNAYYVDINRLGCRDVTTAPAD